MGWHRSGLPTLRRFRRSRAIATAEVLVHPRFADSASCLPQQGAIYAMIESRFGVEVVEVVQEITAAPISAAPGRKLREVGMRFYGVTSAPTDRPCC